MGNWRRELLANIPGITTFTTPQSGPSLFRFDHGPRSLPRQYERITGSALQRKATEISNASVGTISDVLGVHGVHEVELRGLL